MTRQKINSAIILAGGQGRKCWPFGEVRNKCAIPVCNVPNVRRIANQCIELGIRDIAVVVGENAGSIRAALFEVGANVVFVVQPKGAGTAGAVLAGLAAMQDSLALVIYGDLCTTTENLKSLVAAADRGDVCALVDLIQDDPGAWIGAQVKSLQITEISGHNSDARYRLSGAFVIPRGMQDLLAANPGRLTHVPVGGMPPMEPDLAQALADWKHPIKPVEAKDIVVDIDKPWHILEANLRMAEWECLPVVETQLGRDARIHDGAEIEGHVILGDGAEIGNRVVIRGDAIIGPGTKVINGAILGGSNVIGANSEIKDYCLLNARSVVGNHCILGHGAEMDGVMLDRSYLWHYCEISGLVGESVDIGAATVCGTLRFDDGRAEHRVGGRRERPALEANASYFGDHSRTGVNVITNPGAKIGVYSCIGGGVVVTGDVPSRTLRLLKQETIDKYWGPERYGW